VVGLSRQFRTISTIFDIPLPPPYSIPSPVISVVAMALIQALAHFTLRFTSLRFPTFEPPPTFSKTSNACITAVVAEVLAQMFRTILGALSGCFGHDSYDTKWCVSLCFGHDLVSKSVSLCFGHV
jgi:hypothetical protein